MILTPVFKAAQDAGKALPLLEENTVNRVLDAIADEMITQTNKILVENRKDLIRMDTGDPRYDRLELSPKRIESMAADLRAIVKLPSPLGHIIMQSTRPNGMQISKISVPFGVVGIIYEARPNVSVDVFSLCFKSGNACILKGGSDAEHSNNVLVNIIQQVLKTDHIPVECCTLLPSSREASAALLDAVGLVDLIIPRGSQHLIQFVRENSRIPIIETGAGICHTYFDEEGNKEIGQKIIDNAKTRRVSVCNALDCLIIHEKRLRDLPFLCRMLIDNNVMIYADNQAYPLLTDNYPPELLKQATDESFGTEFLDYKMSIKTVSDMEEALSHIARYGSKHSECIISENKVTIALFQKRVDAACVYANVSTAFTDGAQFGLGSEIGISTQKLHARGPMGLSELTTYKWIIQGNGQIRNN